MQRALLFSALSCFVILGPLSLKGDVMLTTKGYRLTILPVLGAEKVIVPEGKVHMKELAYLPNVQEQKSSFAVEKSQKHIKKGQDQKKALLCCKS
ncbi:hypothetical protein [Methylacidiphilum caldifontis]|uniref:Uncharacterized protein n=1 Tax=Methylacidiphilum caldifontis TaxID=2795386 RepID=A0A4Y8PH85_9BACT|nr:hypothetical protein [Methylacidiphilum caldifontis]TFE71775.1 hypothetical protein A7Q10_04065 [Methylacidiphilum caldifontis]